MDAQDVDLQESMEDLNLNNVSISSRFSSRKSSKTLSEETLPNQSDLTTSPRTIPLTAKTHRNIISTASISTDNPNLHALNSNKDAQSTKRKRVVSGPATDPAAPPKPAEKKHKYDTKHVTFCLQNNPGEDPQPQPGPSNDENYEVIAEAAPIWRSARTHRTHENRAHLRAATYRDFLATNVYPQWTYGLERVPDYLKPLTPTFLERFHLNARALTEATYQELIEREKREKKTAENHEAISKSLYNDNANPDYNKAANRAAGILSAYRAQESRKISNYKLRESTNRPSSEVEWRKALEGKPTQSSDRSRQQSRAPNVNKRRRSNTRSPAPAQSRRSSPAPRGRGRGRSGGRGRGRPGTSSDRSDKEQAFLSAMRAFLK